MTIDDLRSTALKSGFKNVALQHDKRTKPYHAQVMDAFGKRRNWYGPWRDTGEEAAQDYLDYIAGQGPQQSSAPAQPKALKSAGHSYDIEKSERGPEIEAALGVLRDYKAQRDGRQGYVYLISDGTAYKIGYSVNPNKRVAELQTGNPRKLSLLASIPGTEADEKVLHQKYISDNLLQEWFIATPELRSEFIKEAA